MAETHSFLEMGNEIQRLKVAVEELSVLNDLAVAASSSTDVDQMLDIIVQKSIKALKAEQGSISLVTDQENNPFRTLIRHMDRTYEQPAFKIGIHITGWVLKHKQALTVENLSTDKRFCASEEERKAVRSVLCVPIWCQAKIIGILMMLNKKTTEPFNTEDLRLLSIIAAQSGQLIHNSRLQAEAMDKKRMEHELSLARRIQVDLLPRKDPSGAGLEVASHYVPAVEVGGDYYDYFSLGDHRVGIVVADVSGHGPSAAMMTTMLKGMLNSMVRQFTSVGDALTEMNLILSQIIPKNMFITMLMLVFDLKNNLLHLSNAGHNPMVHYDSSAGSCALVEFPGCALNVLRNCTYRVKDIPLKSGDLFFIYTDGITEATNHRMEMYDTSGLMQSVQKKAEESPKTIIDQVKDDLLVFTGKTTQADDLLMIAVKVK